MTTDPPEDDGPLEIAVFGDLSDDDSSVAEHLLSVPPGEECTLYFDCPGGSAYRAVALLSLLRLREIQATGVVLGGMLLGSIVAICSLSAADRHALQCSALSPDQMAE